MFSWFRRKKPEQPITPPTATEVVRGDVAFANGKRSWTEPFDVVESLRQVLAERGVSSAARGDSLVLRDAEFVLEPRMTYFQPLDGGSTRTTTIVRISHARLMPASVFEFQHSVGQSLPQSLTAGFESWATIDLPVLLDAVAPEPQSSLVLEMQTASGSRRRGLLGPVGHARERPLDIKDRDEHDFCPCCLFTRCIEAFKSHVEGPGCFAIRLYAVRDAAGGVQADCRVNGDDYEAGRAALVRYVSTWPDCGFEFRKQYAILHDAC